VQSPQVILPSTIADPLREQPSRVDGERFVSVLQGVMSKRVTYNKLTGKTEEALA
jgi:hypothetical protein